MNALLRVGLVSKRFNGVAALSDVSFDVFPGEIHALVGENGAGKTTLINILSGVMAPDRGTIEIAGKARKIGSPREAQALGIATVFQELSLALPASIAENIFAGRLHNRMGFVDWKALHASARKLMKELGVDIDPAARLGRYPIGTRQLVEIAKAISLDARILLLDEPTSALEQDDKTRLFGVLRDLAARGMGIVYISHHLNEIMSLSDRISVLRDGRVAGNFVSSTTKPDDVVRAMVGRDVRAAGRGAAAEPGPAVLAAREIGGKTIPHDASLTLHAGEIVALAGLIGSGRSELAQALCGLTLFDHGTLELNGAPVKFRSLRHAMACGVGYIPSERKTDGLFLTLSVSDNIAAAIFQKLAKNGISDSRRQDNLARGFVDRIAIKVADLRHSVMRLSGGNQQKVLLAKWLATAPNVLIVEEPTRGVDIVAKFEIHRILRELASAGVAILLVSSDLPEIVSLAHRIVIMRQGRVVGELNAEEASEEAVMTLASNVAADAGKVAA
jgi:ABC-type sugar transport system ATPase subunit